MEDKQELLILALPKGRVLEDILPILKGSEFELKDNPKKTRKLVCSCDFLVVSCG